MRPLPEVPLPGAVVPPDAWLTAGYAEWRPPAALRGPVACRWASAAQDRAARDTLVLPDACSDLVWEQGAGAYLAGPDTGPYHSATRAGTVIVGVRFRPAAGGQVLRLPLSELRDQRVPLADALPAAARGLARPLSAALTPAEAAARLLDLAGHLVADRTADLAVARAAAALRDPAARAENLAEQAGLSERQLRFQRFVRLVDAAAELPDLAATAARCGYADQSHLTRECRALSGATPVALHRLRHPATA
jgi:hypothetical protein